MRRLLLGIFTLSLLTSCDDGNIIVTNFDFEDSTLKFCEGPDKNVIYATNNNDVFESISLEFNSNQLPVDENGKLLPPENGEVNFALSGNNRVVYRIYNSEIPTNYFCSVVPPSQPTVIEEWISGTGATVRVASSFTDETGASDPDGDGLKNSEEGWDPTGQSHLDTDADGIPDYLDLDDDGDNVPTRSELANSANDPVNDNGLRDTDEDGIPNYLDQDDDNDGVITRFEVEEGNENNPSTFQTAQGIPNYLNKEQTQELVHEVYISHDIKRNYAYSILIDNLKFTKQDGSGESIQFQVYNLGTFRESGIDFAQCPVMDPDCN
ncbi:hypothetical protein [Christiangramia salexigens]|uniref:Calcium-binding protein n=1 Tax=Christiangramia salexigens TaxID=1913577 RepID=A0A1L3J2N1_9FLAO|nr:hypothetical protein [Christiangramia salexigens]APG59373.1 hypothetical protein LPB144_02650 [Christiangramia salexigens]